MSWHLLINLAIPSSIFSPKESMLNYNCCFEFNRSNVDINGFWKNLSAIYLYFSAKSLVIILIRWILVLFSHDCRCKNEFPVDDDTRAQLHEMESTNLIFFPEDCGENFIINDVNLLIVKTHSEDGRQISYSYRTSKCITLSRICNKINKNKKKN
jgi:hypothetical protein